MNDGKVELRVVTAEARVDFQYRRIDAGSPEALGRWLWDLVEEFAVGGRQSCVSIGALGTTNGIEMRGQYQVVTDYHPV